MSLLKNDFGQMKAFGKSQFELKKKNPVDHCTLVLLCAVKSINTSLKRTTTERSCIIF